MVEEIKQQGVPLPIKRAQTFAEDVAMWTEKAPLCKC